eukprot:CAMPEP_0171187926 /NCGR_PEP_ID=MMETSP0790-20130122/17570_1 /TAXON_ID=2925 /ORGANISM="Alexandrium catenella, Strain OF101" /LENGTH=309 /DNA_ID=CAMNT_0011652997 /DNA_START=53 /DNA_END=982 /DNA_ORIENTATION=+
MAEVVAPAGTCRLRPSAAPRRPRSIAGKALMSGVAVCAAVFATAQQLSAPTPPCFAALAGGNIPSLALAPPRAATGMRGDVALRAEDEDDDEDGPRQFILRPWKGSARYKRYNGYVYRKKKIPGVRLRLERWGDGHWPYYRIKACFQRSHPKRSGRYLEQVGWYDPMKEVSHPRFFKIKADRAVFWLRNGAQPTDMVASLLDRAGIIRRTGPTSKHGEWEWRVPLDSGPEAPLGWSYDGPHEVTWNNMPDIKHRRGHPHSKNFRNIPLIERYGFKGYEKIPIDLDAVSMPLDGDSLIESFGNTELPIYK